MTAPRTPQRHFLDTTLLPRFAAGFAPDARVLNLGAGTHPYREPFRCPVVTSDRVAGRCDEAYPAEAIPEADQTVDGIVCTGVFERLDDPMQALRECARVLKPGGTLLFGAPGLDFPWQARSDRWRLTPGGAAYVVQAFDVLEAHPFGHTYYFYVLRRPA